MRCPKSRFPIWIILFDELELIIFVSQGLTLSTASLVLILVPCLGEFCTIKVDVSLYLAASVPFYLTNFSQVRGFTVFVTIQIAYIILFA